MADERIRFMSDLEIVAAALAASGNDRAARIIKTLDRERSAQQEADHQEAMKTIMQEDIYG